MIAFAAALLLQASPYDAYLVEPGRLVAFARRPSFAEVAAAYPSGASGVGLVDLSCSARATGELYACQIDLEGPTGQGFGAAALALASSYRLSREDAREARRGVSFALRIERPGDRATVDSCIPPACLGGAPPPQR